MRPDTKKKIECKKCHIWFDDEPLDFISHELRLCEDCWEKKCDDAWWEEVIKLDKLFHLESL